MIVLNKDSIQDFPFKWVDLEYLPKSKGKKVEIYLSEEGNLLENLILMFFDLFQNLKSEIRIYNRSWWDFCLDTWNASEDQYNYELEGKSDESKDYIMMLEDSNIENGYSGTCECCNWDKFLYVTLECILTHQAPYSPIFYSSKYNFLFYFHHSGSIGFYFEIENETITRILNTAKNAYEIK